MTFRKLYKPNFVIFIMVKIKKAREINFKYNLKVYWSFLKNYKFIFLFIMFTVIVSALTHLIEKLLFKRIVDDGTNFFDGAITKEIFVGILIFVSVVYSIIIAARAVFKWLHLHYINKLDANMVFDLKRRFFNHILILSHGFHTTHKTGSLISRLGRGASAIERINDFALFNTIPLIVNLLIVGISLIYFDIATSIVVFGVAVVFVVFSIYIQTIQKKAGVELNNAEDFEKANISDIFTNIDSIKYFGKELAIKRRYLRLNQTTREKDILYGGYYRWLDTGHTLILGIGTFLLLVFPIIRLLQGDLSIGTIVFIYTVYGNIFGPLFGFVHGVRGFYKSMTDFESLFQYAKIENDIKDKKNAEDLEIKGGAIEFKNIGFDYGERNMFRDFSLKINKNEKVALVGHSGCGKTTLVKLLYRFYDIKSGEILIDGKSIKDFKQESLRSELSIVPQECVLFDDTIYNNVKFSKLSAPDEEVRKAIKFAQLDKFIETLPKKEKTIVGERGVRLSGGEKQRVSIARALLADKKILVLDEATSSLDSKTEHEIQRDLERLMAGRTSIIIAHRLSTIMGADKIIVMDRGKIVQTGKHEELIRKQGIYRELWDLQKGGYIGQ